MSHQNEMVGKSYDEKSKLVGARLDLNHNAAEQS
jgi:hypothetical protein